MKRQLITVERLEEIARNAILGGYGAVHTWRDGSPRRTMTLDVSMDCEQAYTCELHARDSAWHGKAVKPLTIVLRSRCRQCEPCRRRRTVFWQARATTEFLSVPRTLFGTLTIAPEYDVQIDALARLELHERGVDFDALPPADVFRERVKVGGREVTKWLKRIREGDASHEKPQLRYLLVAEAHDGARTSAEKRGRPHWHFLLHECDLSRPLVNHDEWSGKHDRHGNATVSDRAFLKAQWRLGISSVAHCRTPQAAAYLCKYLTKEETSVRVRASFRYGLEPNGDTPSPAGDVAAKSTALKGEENVGTT